MNICYSLLNTMMTKFSVRRVSMGVIGLSAISLTLYLTIPIPKYDTSLKYNLDPYQYSKFKLLSIENLTQDSKLIKIELPYSKLPNNFISIIHHLWIKQPYIQIERPFTPTNPITQDTKEIELLVKLYKNSEISNYINNLKVNDFIELRGPNLTFDLNLFNRDNLVFIVGGTGITPALQSINTLLSKDNDKKITLIYNSTNEESTYFKSKLLDLTNENNNLRVNFINTSKQGHLDLFKLKHSLGLNTSWFSYFDKNNKINLRDTNFIISGNEKLVHIILVYTTSQFTQIYSIRRRFKSSIQSR